jgi:hypothetical protein
VPLANLPRLAAGAYLGLKWWASRISCMPRWMRPQYAAFFKESRMKCTGATKLHRKSGGSPTIAFAEFANRFWIAKAPTTESPGSPAGGTSRDKSINWRPALVMRKPIALAAPVELYASLYAHDPDFCILYTESPCAYQAGAWKEPQ